VSCLRRLLRGGGDVCAIVLAIDHYEAFAELGEELETTPRCWPEKPPATAVSDDRFQRRNPSQNPRHMSTAVGLQLQDKLSMRPP
jgi:hypothetical protein